MPNWNHVLREIQKEKDEPSGESAVDKVRSKYLQQLHNHTKRNIICYYSGWLSKPKNIEGLEINDEDTNGFMLAVHGLDRSKGLDLFLHTPGGSGAATESIVHYLKKMFGNDIRAFVPQIAMSAGTIIACACKEIFLGHQSNLGPVDPQVNGLHAYAVIEQLTKAYNEIVADNRRAWVWNPMLANYTPGFVQQCDWAIKKVKDLVENYLKENMFARPPSPLKGEKERRQRAFLTCEFRGDHHALRLRSFLAPHARRADAGGTWTGARPAGHSRADRRRMRCPRRPHHHLHQHGRRRRRPGRM